MTEEAVATPAPAAAESPSVQANEPVAAPAQAESAPSSFSIPDEYKDRGWASKVNSMDDLFKAHDNAQSMLGKKFVAPAADASESEWAEYHKAIGVPESADSYELSLSNEAFQGQDLSKYEGRARALMHKLGIPASKANEAWNEYVNLEMSSMAEDQAALDAEFNGLTDKLFGDQADALTQETAEFLKGVATEETAGALQLVQDNPAFASLAMQAHQAHQSEVAKLNAELSDLRKKYGVEDTPAPSGDQVPTGHTMDDLKKQYRDAYAQGQKAAPFSSERREAEQKIADITRRMERLSS